MIPADRPLADDALTVSGLDPATFNPLSATLRFALSDSSFEQRLGAFELQLDGVPIDPATFTVTPAELTVPVTLADGRNELSFRALDLVGRPLFFAATYWCGGNQLTVRIEDGAGQLLAATTQVRVALSDDPQVAATGSTASGSLTVDNVPTRTVVVEARTDDNLVGVGGGLGNEAQLIVPVLGFAAPSAIANNDISLGTDGWTFAPGTVTVVGHDEGLPGAFGGFGVDNDLQLTTQGEGPVTLSRTFTIAAGSTSASLRYRFITSEVPGGFFGTEFNDFFSVSVRSQSGGAIANESNTMNGLGLEAFDFASGATDWRTVVLPVNGTDTVQVDVTVANVADGLFDSSVVVDFVAEQQEPVKPRLAWDAANGGLALTWTVEGGPLQEATSIEVFWAGGPAFGDRSGDALFSFVVPAGTAEGPGGPIAIGGALLTDDPSGTTHVLAATSETNSFALADVSIGFGPNANAAVVADAMLDVVRDALRAAGQSSATITSTARTASDQARAMFQNLVNPANTIAQNIQNQLAIYGPNGDQVIDVFAELVEGLTRAEVLAAEASIRDAMTDKIEELGPSNVSRHCADPEVESVIDVGKSSFSGNGSRFRTSAEPRVDVFLDEPANNAFHLQLVL